MMFILANLLSGTQQGEVKWDWVYLGMKMVEVVGEIWESAKFENTVKGNIRSFKDWISLQLKNHISY